MSQTPDFIYGTAWKEDDTRRCVTDALAAGFRAIDTANQRRHYHEAAVGEALAAAYSQHPRESLFLQSKFTYRRGQDDRLPYDPDAPLPEQVAQSVQSSLAHLHTDYIDSFLLHGPAQRQGLSDDDRAVWQAMEGLHRAGVLRQIGVSNVTVGQLRKLLSEASVPPRFVQNRCYARSGWDAAVRALCVAEGIAYQGFSLLTANRTTWGHADTAAVARTHGVSTAQVIFRCARALGILPITGTTKPEHMIADLRSGEIGLSESEIATVTTIEAP
jgi:diketogulonate reductase-like aldo/keto reductase